MLKLAWKYMRYYKSQTFAIFASILLTASLLSGISSLIYSSQKSDLANSKTIYGDWHYYIETDKELFNSVESGEKGKGNKNDSKRTKSGSQNCVCGSSNRRIERSDGSGTDDV